MHIIAAIQGDYFTAINMGFENSTGPQKHQAVALRVQGDKAIYQSLKARTLINGS